MAESKSERAVIAMALITIGLFLLMVFIAFAALMLILFPPKIPDAPPNSNPPATAPAS